jgi:DNA replication protein DnaC
VQYYRTLQLLKAFIIAHSNGRLNQLLAKTDLLTLNDWRLEKMSLIQRNDLLEIMEDRHGLKFTLITGQLPINGTKPLVMPPWLMPFLTAYYTMFTSSI